MPRRPRCAEPCETYDPEGRAEANRPGSCHLNREILHVGVWDLWPDPVTPRSEDSELLRSCCDREAKAGPYLQCIPYYGMVYCI